MNEEEIRAFTSATFSTDLTPEEFAFHEMVKTGINPAFIKKIESAFEKEEFKNPFRDQIVKMNVLGFLSPGDYSKHFNDTALSNIRTFIKKNALVLKQAEEKFGVDKTIIASLLWVETRFGKSVGKFNLPLVFYSLSQATHPDVAKAVLLSLNDRKPASNSSASDLSYSELQKKVLDRLTIKSKWAIDQMKALETLSSKSFHLTIPSSFAGAFGCSQFIPTSYEKYAISYNGKAPNLFKIQDCIYSVANFLKTSGWDPADPTSQSKALFEYNRIKDYGDVILKLAKEVKRSP